MSQQQTPNFAAVSSAMKSRYSEAYLAMAGNPQNNPTLMKVAAELYGGKYEPVVSKPESPTSTLPAATPGSTPTVRK